MDPVTIIALASAAVQLFNSFVNQGMNEADAKAAVAAAKGISVPDLDDLMVQAEQMGIYGDVGAGEARQAELDALRQLGNVASTGGMDDASIAAMEQAGSMAAQQARGAREAAMAQAQRTGTLGSGNAFMAQQMANQGASDSLRMAGTQAIADARQRALQAMTARGALAGQSRGADEALGIANRQAQMERDRFNTEIRTRANEFNSGAYDRRFGMESQKVNQINSARGRGMDARSAGTQQTNRGVGGLGQAGAGTTLPEK